MCYCLEILVCRGLWDHMNKMAAIILSMCETTKDMPHSSYLSVKELLASSSWKYLHDCPDRKHTKDPPKIVMEGENDYREHFYISGILSHRHLMIKHRMCLVNSVSVYIAHKILRADLLLYIFEAFFPFLKIFFAEFYRFDQTEHFEMKTSQTIDSIFEALLVC